MIGPIRREFGRNLDVKTFLRDLDYRQEIIAQALQSQDTRLREYAAYMQQLHGGPRTASAPPSSPRAAAADEARTSVIESAFRSTELPSTQPEPTSREDELRAQIMRKYTTGLR